MSDKLLKLQVTTVDKTRHFAIKSILGKLFFFI